MTKEEAIIELKKKITCTIGELSKDEYNATVMAIEALQKPVIVQCKDCRYADECHKSVHFTHNEPNAVTIGYTGIYFCSNGERKGGDTE